MNRRRLTFPWPVSHLLYFGVANLQRRMSLDRAVNEEQPENEGRLYSKNLPKTLKSASGLPEVRQFFYNLA